MPWPSSPGFIKTNLDQGTDSPATARADLHNALTDLESVIAGRNQANGVAPLDGSSKVPTANLPTTIPLANLPAIPIHNGSFFWQEDIIGGTWEVPAGITRVLIYLAGAGGGGGYAAAAGGGGGGGGSTIIIQKEVTPGSNITYTIGGAGAAAAGPGDGDGTDGGNSTISGTGPGGAWSHTARGGKGGKFGGDFGDGGTPDFGAMIGMYGARGGYGTTKGGMGGSATFGPAGGSCNWGGGGYGGGNGVPAAHGGDGAIAIFW